MQNRAVVDWIFPAGECIGHQRSMLLLILATCKNCRAGECATASLLRDKIRFDRAIRRTELSRVSVGLGLALLWQVRGLRPLNLSFPSLERNRYAMWITTSWACHQAKYHRHRIIALTSTLMQSACSHFSQAAPQ